MYFNIDVKEQELKKVIEDADEIISELNYISDTVVQEIEDKMRSLQSIYNNAQHTPSFEQSKPVIKAIPISLKSKLSSDKSSQDRKGDIKLSPKQQSVFELSEQGLSIMEIAKKLNLGQGEVKLMLSLKNEVYHNE